MQTVSWSAVPFLDDAGVIHRDVAVRFDRGDRWMMRATTSGGELLCERPLTGGPTDPLQDAIEQDRASHARAIPLTAAFHPEASPIEGDGVMLAGVPRRPDQPLFPGCFPAVGAASRAELEQRHQAGQLAVAALPTALPTLASLPTERWVAMLLGVAIGDAMGSPSESMTADERRRRFGYITEVDPSSCTTDDTQMTVRSLRVLSDTGRLSLDALARRWSGERLRGIGQITRRAFDRFASCFASGEDVWTARITTQAAGNGAVMRVAGMLAPHAAGVARQAAADVLLSSALTHDDATSSAACWGWAELLAGLGDASIRSFDDIVARFLAAARPIEGEETVLVGRAPAVAHRGMLCDFIERHLRPAHRAGARTDALRAQWYSGAYLLETMPTTLSIVAQYIDAPTTALLVAVNDTWDNDTIASMVAAAMGARHGLAAFDPAWLASILAIDAREAQAVPGDSLVAAIESCRWFAPEVDEVLAQVRRIAASADVRVA